MLAGKLFVQTETAEQALFMLQDTECAPPSLLIDYIGTLEFGIIDIFEVDPVGDKLHLINHLQVGVPNELVDHGEASAHDEPSAHDESGAHDKSSVKFLY